MSTAWTNISGTKWTRWTICSGCSTVSLWRTSLILCFAHSRQTAAPPMFLTFQKSLPKPPRWTPPCSRSSSKSKKPAPIQNPANSHQAGANRSPNQQCAGTRQSGITASHSFQHHCVRLLKFSADALLYIYFLLMHIFFIMSL